MSTRGPSDEAVIATKLSAEERLFALPAVTRVGIGPKYVRGQRTSQLAIVVYVEHKRTENELEPSVVIPKQIGGIPTDVEEGGAGVMFADENRYRPLMGGAKIETFPIEAKGELVGFPGTLGFAARMADASQSPVVITCAHVAYWSGRIPDERIGQPSASAGWSDCCSDLVGKRAGRLYTPLVDAALIDLLPSVVPMAQVVELGAVKPPAANRLVPTDLVPDPQDPTKPPVKVLMRGQATGEKRTGIVRSVTLAGTASPPPLWDLPDRAYVDQMDIAPVGADAFGQFGDSGAAILKPSGNIVGMLWGGDPDSRHGFATQIADVTSSLGVNVATNPPAVPLQAQPQPSALPVAALGPMERELRRTAGGAAFVDLVRVHKDELADLVSHNRRTTIAWHRNSGPSILYYAWRAVEQPDAAIPDAVDGQPLAASLQRILDAFHDEGSPGLRAAIAHVEPLLQGLEGGTYGQMLARLDLDRHLAREARADQR